MQRLTLQFGHGNDAVENWIVRCNSYRYRIVKEQQALARDPRETAASSASSQNVLSLVGRVRRPADQESVLGFPKATTLTQPRSVFRYCSKNHFWACLFMV